jgi:hypothetical protein
MLLGILASLLYKKLSNVRPGKLQFLGPPLIYTQAKRLILHGGRPLRCL